jgi:predicted protein tyrosine phosphatase
VCGGNRFRSPTAEQIFADHPGLEVSSAGTRHDADNPLTSELMEWADAIFVMERRHGKQLRARFGCSLGDASVVCLDIPDKFGFMDEELIRLLKARMASYLPHVPSTELR